MLRILGAGADLLNSGIFERRNLQNPDNQRNLRTETSKFGIGNNLESLIFFHHSA
jgi:hypothetical protein